MLRYKTKQKLERFWDNVKDAIATMLCLFVAIVGILAILVMFFDKVPSF